MSTRRKATSPQPRPVARPLPPKPSLEYERKQAKALLRQLRAGNADALARARARHDAFPRFAIDITLADAQVVIAREYGFASWPRLVQYFRESERQSMARHNRSIQDPVFYERSALSLIQQHGNRRPNAARTLAASVPRLYGLTIDEVFAATISEAEARLAVARQYGCPSWDELMTAIARARTRHVDPWRMRHAPLRLAREAISAGDRDALARVIAEHPQLLHPSLDDRRDFLTVVHLALAMEERGVPGARTITDWLATQGVDVPRAMNERLMDFFPRLTIATIRFLLDRGADPAWIAPNGVSVLEYALLRSWNAEAVDVIASRVTPRPALWIAAGLGRLDEVARFLDSSGKPTPAAYRHRPDFAAVGLPLLAAPAPDDAEILAEAFFVAMLNDRIAVLDYLIDRGFPIDYLGWEMPFVNFAVGNQRLLVVECLVRRGANLDIRGRHPDVSARELARSRFEQRPADPTARRILELCDAGDPDRLLAEVHARPAPEPQAVPGLNEALDLAADDAARRHEAEVPVESLVIGVMRATGFIDMLRAAGVDTECLRAQLGTRVLSADDRVEHAGLSLGADARRLMATARDIARRRKSDVLTPATLLAALIEADDPFLKGVLMRCGSDIDRLRASIERVL